MEFYSLQELLVIKGHLKTCFAGEIVVSVLNLTDWLILQ